MQINHFLCLTLTIPYLLSANSGETILSLKSPMSEIEVAPTEDLMQEHGVLSRIMLIYEEIITRIDAGIPFSPELLKDSALIIRHFIEDHHEKIEETHLFPRFEQANKLVDLVQTLRDQHQEGRLLTTYIINHANHEALKDQTTLQEMKTTLQQFITMYRPHQAREDTVLFPAFRLLITEKEYHELGEMLEHEEHELFGEDGFNKFVEKVAFIEKSLGIHDLTQFSP